MQGIGETFQPNLFSGTGNFTVPIAASPGRAGFGPQLSLQYSTGNANGPFGLGWKLSIPRITRKTEKGLPRYTDEDVFVLSGAEDLVLSNNQPSEDTQPAGYFIVRYRPRTEGLFARIEKWTQTDGEEVGDVHWRIVTKDNVTNIYGKSKSARITDPDHADHVYEWLLEETYDNKGNHIVYEYVQEDPNLQIQKIFEQNKKYTQAYIRRILYGNTPDTLDPSKQVGPKRVATHHLDPTQPLERHYLFELLFDYGDLADLPEIPFVQTSSDTVIPEDWPIREDPFSTFRPGFEVRTLRRCKRVWMLHHFQELNGAPLVRSTDFEYDVNPETRLSILKTVQVSGYRKQGESYLSSAMPPVSFTYSKFEPHKQHYQSVTAKGNDLPPRSLNDREFSLVDLFGDALPDIVQTTNEGYYYWRNLGDANVDRRHPQHEPIPSVSTAQPNVTFGDMGGDGVVDLVVEAPPLAGFFESMPDGRWKPFRKFEKFPSVNLGDANVRLLDLTGDGLSDILMTGDQHFLWFQCLGEEGYGEPQHVARVHNLNEFPDIYFNETSGRVRLADMTGDGLNDIVLMHDGRIDYWPNLGYGRFGRRVTMAQSPRLPYNFDPRRLFLVDLDGTGCADLVYVDFKSVHFWFNQSGNGWSEKQTIQGTPYVSDLSAIQFADFFGTGTTCLIWSYDYLQQSNGNYKVLDFCGGNKPHLLVEMNNNMGATTRVQYAASTTFYLEDKAAGTPWATNLPFPVQVVQKTEVIDHISKTKLVTTYKYHHGYYDGREREFRGFGRVDQYDSEEFEAFTETSLHGEEIEFENKNQAHHVPPVLTKTWFHTGVYFDEDNISPSGVFYDHNDLMEAYRREFYDGDEEAFVLDSHEVEHSGTPHEAYRALRGAIIRTEVFALDGSDKAEHPYTVAENRYSVKELQARDGNNHAVYLTTEKESVSYHYERNPQDPRIGQNLVLAVDEFGHVTDSLSVAYPGRQAPADLPEQAELKAVYTKTDFINKDDDPEYYYLGIPCQTRTYEVTGVNWSPGQVPLKPEMFTDIVNPALVPGNFQPYEWQRPEGHAGLEKRIVEWQRSYFRADAAAAELDIALNAENHPTRMLGNRLPLGEIQKLALPYESYTAAFTDELLAQFFAGPANISEAMLLEGGYHQEPDIDGYRWVPSGQLSFDPPQFYLSEVARDPFAVDTNSSYDDYALMTVEAIDALGNKTLAKIDYRMLQPYQVTDPNGNHSFAAFDELGMVVGTAVRSKSGDGDSLDGFVTDLSDQQIQNYLEKPQENGAALLAKATSRMIYDLWAYHRGEQQSSASIHPPVIATLSREVHDSGLGSAELPLVQHSFLYSDGFARTVQSKVQAEPDPASPDQPRWVGTGTTVYNNKGKPVQQYEPFFSDTHLYGIEQHGVSPTLLYDPLERVVCTLNPNHTYAKVVFDPWRQETWDVNDTIHPSQRWNPALPEDLPDPGYNPADDPDVGYFFSQLESNEYLPTWYQRRMDDALASAFWPDAAIRQAEQQAAKKAARHAATPTIAHLDTSGRTFLTLADNGHEGDYQTRVKLDIEGNQLAVTDALARTVMKYEYGIMGRQLKQVSMEAGTRWMWNDVAGNPIYGWDSRGHRMRHVYDALRRPTGLFVSDNGNPEVLAEKTVYGESQANPEQNNLRGRVYQVFDGAGVVTSLEYDFKGNLLSSQRQLLQDYKNQVDWTASPSMEPELFTSSTRYDALNRAVQIVAPHSDQAGTKLNVIQPKYNEANLLERVDAWLQQGVEPQGLLDPATADLHAVENIDHDAKGQRTHIEYGNKAFIEYHYDEDTFRLIHLKTTRATFPNNEKIVQDLHYAYDPVGNITSIRDDAQQTIYFNNTLVEPHAEYRYDAIYRLIEAKGREHIGQLSKPETTWKDEFRTNLAHRHDGLKMRPYTEKYEYDQVGNILNLIHQANNNGSWTRTYNYNEASLIEPGKTNDRLSTTAVGNTITAYNHDAHGSMTSMPHIPEMQWDFEDQMHEVDLLGGGRLYMVYDVAGQRVRKVHEHNGAIMEERIYLGGFEIYRKRNGNGLTLERETLHIMDDTRRIALVETRTHGDDDSPQQLVRYQFGNHLGSASLELDEGGKIISYEEYYPYGSTSYQAVGKGIKAAAKRYRYTGKERDEETGLYYHGARYYACWLGRWTAADPAGLVDGTNLYASARNNPLTNYDKHGFQSVEVPPKNLDEAGRSAIGVKDYTRSQKTPPHVEVPRMVIKAKPTSEKEAPKETAPMLSPTERLHLLIQFHESQYRYPPTYYRITGGFRAVTGGLGLFAAAAFSGETGGLGLAPASLVATVSLDEFLAGARQVYSGEPTSTYRYELGSGIALIAGADPAWANVAGTSADIFTNAGAAYFSLRMNPFKIVEPPPYQVMFYHGQFEGRDIVTVSTPSGPRAFYLRTGGGGSNIGGAQAGEWAPFEGFTSRAGFFDYEGSVYKAPEGWFVKHRFVHGLRESDPMYRFGSPEGVEISNWLSTQEIPTGGPATPYGHVQSELQFFGVSTVDPMF